MRKKYLSALLFGALLFASAGTFQSCKDYDDDIDNLQGQIDENEASLTEKLAAVESSISSLQSAQSAMQAAIEMPPNKLLTMLQRLLLKQKLTQSLLQQNNWKA